MLFGGPKKSEPWASKSRPARSTEAAASPGRPEFGLKGFVRVQGLKGLRGWGFRVWGLGFRVQGFRV